MITVLSRYEDHASQKKEATGARTLMLFFGLYVRPTERIVRVATAPTP